MLRNPLGDRAIPSIADVWVSVAPETSKVAEGITRALREADPKVAEAGRRWGKEIERGIGETKVEIKADTAKARAEIDAAAKDRHSTIHVDVDKDRMGRAAATTASALEKTVVTGLASVAAQVPGQFVQAGQGAATAMSQGMQSGMSQFAGVASSVGGQVGSIISAAATPVIIGGLALAIGGVISSLSGGLGLIPGALAGGGAVFGTLALGLDGVKNAWDAASKASMDSGKEQVSHARDVVSAQLSLKNAVQDEGQAQKDVANARKDALRQLQDLNLELRGGALDEKQAILDAQAARRDLATGRFKDSIEYEQAVLRVQEADQRVAQSHQRNIELQQDASQKQAKGVEGSDQVVAANQRLERSHDSVAQAQSNLNFINSQTGSAAQAAAQAMSLLSPNAQAFVNTLMSMKPAFQDFKNTVQDALFANMGPMFQQLATTYLPMLTTSLSQMASLLNQSFGQLANLLTQPATMGAIQNILTNVNAAFQAFTPTILTLTQAFIQMSSVGSGFLPELGKIIGEIATEFAKWVNGPDFGKFIQDGLNALHQMVPIMFSLMGIFRDLAPIGPPVLQAISDILTAMAPYVPGLAFAFAQLVQSIAPLLPGLTAFATGGLTVMLFTFTKIIDGVKEVIHWITGLVDKFENAFHRIGDVVNVVWAIIGPIINKITNALNIMGGPLAWLAKQIGALIPHIPGMDSSSPSPAPAAGPGAFDTGSGQHMPGPGGFVGTPRFWGSTSTGPTTAVPWGAGATVPGMAMPTIPGLMPASGLPDAHGAHSQIAMVEAIAQQFGLKLTAGKDDHAADGGFHPAGMAGDFSNAQGNSPQELAFAKYMAENFGPYIKELIYSDPQFNERIGGPYSAAVLAEHQDHVHVAITDQMAQAFMQSAGSGGMPTGLSMPTSMTNSALFSGEGPQWYGQAFAHNSPFAVPSATNWQTQLSPEEEKAFADWVRQKKVPFDPAAGTTDYDMRGFWKDTGGKWDGGHFPDTWKTPYDTTFSAESRYAKTGTPFKWQGDNLIDDRSGQLIFGTGSGISPMAPMTNSSNLSTGSSKAQIAQSIYSSLISAGYSPETATAAVASSLLESGLNPNITNASGHNSLFQTSADKGISNDPNAQIQWWLKEAAAQGGPAAANADPFNFIANKVERGGYPGSDYKKFLGEAQSLIGQGGVPGMMPGQMQLGTQQQPMYVDYGPNSSFGKASGGEQLGQDIFSGLLQVFGFDGSVFKNPTGFGAFKMFKGLMGSLTGSGKQGQPGSYYAQGGDGASQFAPGGGGDALGGGLNFLQGLIPGSQFAPTGAHGGTHQPVDNRIVFNGPVGNVNDAQNHAQGWNVPRARQALRPLP